MEAEVIGSQRITALVLVVASLAVSFVGSADPESTTEPRSDSLQLRLRPLPDGVREVRLESDGHGGHWYVLDLVDGGEQRLRPTAFAARLQSDQRSRTFAYRLLNITSAAGFAWVALGLLGQLLFTGRMVLQWLVSEIRNRSVVPVGFWWMSITGASMLLTYFVWRRDIVGVLGQGAGWMIYARNLSLIYAERKRRP